MAVLLGLVVAVTQTTCAGLHILLGGQCVLLRFGKATVNLAKLVHGMPTNFIERESLLF